MQTAESLLQAIYDAPDEDAPRLAYADWLNERGDPRGEFLALQLKKRSATLTEAEAEREVALAREHWREWLGALGEVATFFEGVELERGFPSSSYVSFKTLEQCIAVLDAPELATVRGLTVLGHEVPGTTVLAYLCGREKPSPLRYFGFELGPPPAGAELAALVHPRVAEALPRLSTIWVNATGAPVTSESLGWLTRGPLASRIERLVVTGLAAGFHLEPWWRVIESTPNLRVLDLMRTAVDEAGVTWTWWWQLRRPAEGAKVDVALSIDPQFEAAAVRAVDAALVSQHARAIADDLQGLGRLPSLRLACNLEEDDTAAAGTAGPDASDVQRYAAALAAEMRRLFDEVHVVAGGPLR